MNKYFKLLVTGLLTISTLTGVFAAGCNQNESSGENPNDGRKVFYKTFEGIHKKDAPEVTTDNYLVKNGKTEYTLVVPEKLDSYEKTAKDEFVLLFRKATGITISVRPDTEIEDISNAKIISIGETLQKKAYDATLGAEAKLEEDNTLGRQGVRIVTVGDDIFLYTGNGGDVSRIKSGSIYAVYDFMEIYFNFDYFYRNCISLDKGVAEAKLRNFDVVDVPDLKHRTSWNTGDKATFDGLRAYEQLAGIESQDIQQRLNRTRKNDEEFMMTIFSEFGNYSSTNYPYHNSNMYMSLLSPGVEEGWFSTAGSQLCYTARGDDASYRRMVEYCARKVENSMLYYNTEDFPTRNYFTLTHEDNEAHCTCAECIRVREANNNTYAAAECRLLNDVIDLVYEWMADPSKQISQEPYRRDNLKGVFFAYKSSSTAPAYWDEKTGKFVPYNDDCIPNENVIPWICSTDPITFDVYDPYADVKTSNLAAWDDIANETWYWFYNTHYVQPTHFCNNFNKINNNFWQFLLASGMTYYFDNITSSAISSDNTAFVELKLYLESKLDWDASQNVVELTNKYFDAMYDGVSEDMKIIFQNMINQRIIMEENPAWGGNSVSGLPNKPEYYSYSGFLKPMIEDYRDILAKVDDLYGDTDPAYAELIKSRVCMEYVNPLFVTLSLHCRSASTSVCTSEVRQGYKQDLIDMSEKYFPSCTVQGNVTLKDFANSIG